MTSAGTPAFPEEMIMKRRDFLAATTAVTAAAATLKFADAATEPLLGETGVGVPVPPNGQLPLGPLVGSRYPDAHIEALDKRFNGSPGTGALPRGAPALR